MTFLYLGDISRYNPLSGDPVSPVIGEFGTIEGVCAVDESGFRDFDFTPTLIFGSIEGVCAVDESGFRDFATPPTL